MTTRKPFRSQWVPKQEEEPNAPVVTEDILRQKALKLPMFGPGKQISVPERVYPAYMKIYHLEPIDDGLPPRPYKPMGIVMVRRVKESHE